MADDGHEALEPLQHVALADADMIDVEHDLQVGCADRGDDVRRRLERRVEIAGRVALVERLEEERQPVLGGLGGGALEIAYENRPALVELLGRNLARHGMDGDRAGGDAIGDRLVDRRREFLFATGHRTEAEVLPRLADRGVDAEKREPVPHTGLPHPFGGDVVRPVQLDRLEAGRGRRVDPVKERLVGPEESEIGGEPGHLRATLS